MARENVATGRKTPGPGFRLTTGLHNLASARMGAVLAITSETTGLQRPNRRYPWCSADLLDLIIPFALEFNQTFVL